MWGRRGKGETSGNAYVACYRSYCRNLSDCLSCWRLVEPMSISRGRKLAAWLCIAVLLYGQRVLWFIRRESDGSELFNVIDWIGYSFLGLVSIVVVFMLLRDFPILVRRTVDFARKFYIRRSRRPYFIGPDRERRRFLLNVTNAGILAVSMPMAGYAVYEARRKPSVVSTSCLLRDFRKDSTVSRLPRFQIRISDRPFVVTGLVWWWMRSIHSVLT